MSTLTLTHLPTSVVVQLHGFRAAERGQRAFDVIVSDGNDQPHPWAEAWVELLNTRWAPPAGAALFPRDTTALGATGNVLGRYANLHAPGRFVHLELSDNARETLLDDPSPLQQVFEQLLSQPPQAEL